MYRTLVAAAVVTVLIAGSGCQAVLGPGAVESSFDDGADDWTVTGDAQGGSTDPVHETEGGNPGGYVSASDDVSGGVWYWNASAAYLGDQSAYVGGTLSFDLRQSATSSQFDSPDVVLASGSAELYYAFDNHPDTDWTGYDVPLEADAWRDAETDEAVTEEAFRDVLSDLDRLWIRGEYRTGSDTGGLDTVVMRPS